jgi:hypothetical protein
LLVVVAVVALSTAVAVELAVTAQVQPQYYQQPTQ